MQEIILIGRGGQGILIAAEILADTLMQAGFEVQSFPEFMAERRGAPIRAYLRFDRKPINLYCRINKADAILVFDPTVFTKEDLEMLKPEGMVFVASAKPIALGKVKSYRVDAKGIAISHRIFSSEKVPLGNMAVISAFLKILNVAGLEDLKQVIARKIPKDIEGNQAIAIDGYNQVVAQKISNKIRTPASQKLAWDLPEFPVTLTTTLRSPTGSWKMLQPKFTEKCTTCQLCQAFCPDGAIYKLEGSMLLRADFCKGCEICGTICPIPGALEFEEVG